MSSTTTRLGSWIPVVVGVVFALVHVRMLVGQSSLSGLFLDATPPLLASFGILVAGVWFVARSPDAESVARMTRWLVVGAVGAVVVGLWATGHAVGDVGPDVRLLSLVTGSAAVGSLFGIALGVYDARSRTREEQVERTRSMARAERDRFAALFENVLNPVVYYEFDGDRPVFRAVNGAFEGTFGFTESEVRGRPVDEVIVPPERIEEATDINERIREGDAVQRELRRLTAHGVRDFLVSVVPVEGTERAAGFFIAIDITEQKRRDRRLQVLNRVLRHDLRNAMNVILGYIDLLGTSPEATERAAGVIRRRAEEMVSLSEKARTIEDALHVGDAPEDARTDVVSVLRRRLSVATTDHEDLTVDIDAPDRALARIRDQNLFEEAIDNVVENVVKHVEGDPRLDVTVSVDDADVVMRFEDNGPGIPEQELSVLASDRETQLEHLSGLGLWLINWVIENTDGQTTFESTETGSVVTFYLPRVEAPENGEGVSDLGEPDGERADGADEADDGDGERE